MTRGLTMMVLLASTMAVTGQQSPTAWRTVWAASAHGPYPSGNASAQPVLSFAFADPSRGARDQAFRLIVKPDVWSAEARVRLTNAFGTQPIMIDGVFAGLQASGAEIVSGTNSRVTFDGQTRVTLPPGATRWSDAVHLPFVAGRGPTDLAGRKLAVSLAIVGDSGPMTWHAKALQTSYLSRPGVGAVTQSETETAFPFSTTSWYFVDAVDMRLPTETKVIVAFGDSITDGTASTLNADDRWPDVLSRRLHRAYGDRAAVVNAGIGGNQVVGPAVYSAAAPIPGGPSAGDRLERDVLSLSGVSTVIWLEGINDLSRTNRASVEAITSAMRAVVSRIRARLPGVRILGGTVLPALRASNAAHGSAEQDAARRDLNAFIRTSGLFDAVVDFEAATMDPATGELRPEFVPDSTTGGPGDRLHPNRAGYLAMGEAIDLAELGLARP